MSHFAVLDIEKLKGADVDRVMAHNRREKFPANADPGRSHLNRYDIRILDWKSIVEASRTRSDNVEVVNIVLTSDNEYFANLTPPQLEWWRRANEKWIEEKFGKENVQGCYEHHDETTIHQHWSILPVLDGELNAKHWFGGKKALAKLHDDYAAAVEHLGLSRGKNHVKASEKTIGEFYDAANEWQEKDCQEVKKIFERKTLGTKTILGIGITDMEDDKDILERAVKEVGQYLAGARLGKLSGEDRKENIRLNAKVAQLESSIENLRKEVESGDYACELVPKLEEARKILMDERDEARKALFHLSDKYDKLDAEHAFVKQKVTLLMERNQALLDKYEPKKQVQPERNNLELLKMLDKGEERPKVVGIRGGVWTEAEARKWGVGRKGPGR